MCECTSAPDARLVEANTRWPEPLIAHEPFVLLPVFDQLRPAFVGTTSSSVLPVAVPAPMYLLSLHDALPISAETDPTSEVLVTWTSGQFTTIATWPAEPVPPLVEV